MRRAKAKLTVSTFPFLAVLLCAMGSLIMLLMVFDQRAKRAARERNLQHAVEVAKQEEERWKNAQALMARKTAEEEADRAEQIRKLRQEGENRLRELEKDSEKIQNSERDALAVRSAEEKKIEGLRQQTLAAEKDKEKNSEELARLKASLNQARRDQLDREAKRLRRKAEVEVAKKAIEAEVKAEKDRLDRLATELGDLEKVLKQAEDKKERSAQTFSIIPYRGKRGDDKRPIYVECTWNKLIFHPDKFVVDPGDPRMGLLTQIEERAKAQNRLYMEAGLSAHPRPFLMLLVRPDGISTYYQFQVAVKGQAIDFGYELIDQEWELDFPQDPPPKTNLANAPAGSAPFKNNPDGKNGGTGLNGFAGGQPGSPGGSAGGALSPGGGNGLANGAGFGGGQPGSPAGPLGGPGGFGGPGMPGGLPGQDGSAAGSANGTGSVRGFRAGTGNGNGGGMAGLVTGPGGMPGGGNGTGNSPLPGNLSPGFGLGGGPGGVGAPGGPGGLGPNGGNGPGGFGPGTGTGLGGNGTGVGGPFPGGTGSLANGPGGTGLGGGNGPVPGVGGTSGTGGASGPGQLALGGGNGSGNGTPGFPAGQGTGNGFGLGGGQGGTPGNGGAAGNGALALGGNGGGSGQPGLPGGQGTGNGTGLGGGTGTGVPGLPNPDKTDGVMGNGAVPGVAMSPQRIPGPTAPALGATGLTKQGSFGGLPGPLPGVGGGEPGGEGGPGGSGNGSSGMGGAGGAGGSGPPGAGGTGRGDNGPGGIAGGQGSPDGGKPGTGPGGGGVAGEPGTPGGSSQGQPGGSPGASGQPGSLPPMDGPPAFPSVGSSGAAGSAGGGTPGLSVNLNPMDDQKPQEGARMPKPTGASGDGFPGNEDAAMDPLGRLNIPLPTVTENRPKPPRPLRPAKLTGGREMTHFVECTAEGVILHPGGKKFSKQSIIQPEVANPLLQELKEKVERRRTLDKAAGSTSYIQVRFLVWPDGMRAYHALYPAVSTWGVFSQQQTINNPQDLREALSRP